MPFVWYPPVLKTVSIWTISSIFKNWFKESIDNFLQFTNNGQTSLQTISSYFWKKCQFLPILKNGHNGLWTISSCFCIMLRMAFRQFPPVSEKRSEWPMDNFLPFLNNGRKDLWTISSNFWKMVRTAFEQFPPISEKWSEQPLDNFLQFLKNG